MSKYFKENGFLSEEGKRLVEIFSLSLDTTFKQDSVKKMSESELRTLGAALSNMIGNQVSALITAKNDLEKKFEDMTDEQFTAFMKVKYGDKWMLVAITKEEMDRVRKMSLLADDESAKKIVQMYISPSKNIDPGLRFK